MNTFSQTIFAALRVLNPRGVDVRVLSSAPSASATHADRLPRDNCDKPDCNPDNSGGAAT